MSIEDYEYKIIEKFYKNRKLYIIRTFGKPEISFELRLTDGYITYDVFFLTKHNKTNQFLSYFEETFFYKYKKLKNFQKFINFFLIIFLF